MWEGFCDLIRKLKLYTWYQNVWHHWPVYEVKFQEGGKIGEVVATPASFLPFDSYEWYEELVIVIW